MVDVPKLGRHRGEITLIIDLCLIKGLRDKVVLVLVQSRPSIFKKRTEKQDSEVPISGCLKGIRVRRRCKLTR